MSETREHDAPAAVADPFVLMDATAQAELVRRREVSPAELVEAAITRIEAVNGPINAVVHKVYDRARAQAAGPVGEGPFAGVPFLVKDLLAVAGVPNTSSCRVLDGVIGEANTPYSQAFDDAGLILVGLTNTPEFGLIDTTEPALRGPSRNPWNLAHSTAGSSGGSAAAVAAGLTPMAHANDGGGSIRLPACHNGVFGLKPSRGRQRDDGFPPLPLGLPALAIEHVVSRSVRDSALMLSLSEDPETPLGRLGFVSRPLDRPLRIALIREGAHGLPAAPDVDAATLSVARLCEDLGHTVVPAHWPFGGDVTPAFLDEWSVVAAGVVAGVCAATGCKPEPPNFEPWTLSLAEHAYALTLGRVVEVVATLGEATRQLTTFFETYDVLLSPVMRHPPKLIGDHATDQPSQDLWDKAVDNVAYTPVFNASGMPAMSVPLSWSPSGLPIGAQFAAGLGKDGLLLELAYQLEAARPWADRWAPHSFPVLARR